MADSQASDQRHLVVALKYRPQTFQSLVGQDHIATALGNAIKQNRVGHAYLFTGARGVGKTSSARIFTKCLNCEKGPSPVPCEECETCQAISVGEDVDVIEIDGASNRGIDEIRQLRANAAVRPSRSPNKIYIIDEVHMLTKEAFNALLKTLEEPPAHVKFIFCTTDPEKIPITVLSRCQRFDFSPVQTSEIADRLRLIATEEGVGIDDQALALLARRANGSMRDSQSLLEQMLSFSDKEITVDDVHQLLGTADTSRIAGIAEAMAAKDSAGAINAIHQGVVEGVDPGQVANQLLGYFRDMMAVRVGSNEETLLNCSPQDIPQLQSLADQFGLETILMITQIIDGTVVKMQSSLHGRTLLEVATVRICNLEHLDSMVDLVAGLRQGGAPVRRPAVAPASGRPKVEMRQVEVDPPKKKEISKTENVAPTAAPAQAASAQAASAQAAPAQAAPASVPPSSSVVAPAPPKPTPPSKPVESVPEKTVVTAGGGGSKSFFATRSAEDVWREVVGKLEGMTADMAGDFQTVVLAEPGRLLVTLADKVNKDFCAKPERKHQIEELLLQHTGETVKVDFAAGQREVAHEDMAPKLTRVQQIRQLESNNFVSDAMSIFEAEITGFKETRRR
ncbi:UNVERIFIED_CONTAM: hypothetical protein GTU68_001463 [Idotea baltica]|nr:hypothetical protein [Idotea baltica]